MAIDLPYHQTGPELAATRILCVDDQPANNRLLEMTLRAAGYLNVTTTTDPRQALEWCEAQDFGLILLDYNMPGMDGLEVIRQLRERFPASFLPVMMITALNDRNIRLEALNLGAQDFINKPFDRLEVIPRVRNILTMHQLYQNLESKVRERTRQLESTRQEIIARLGRAAEYRDNETGNHVIRVSRFAAVVGESLGLSAGECELLLQAVPMHDIGKIGIPDHILLKPGKLTPEEFTAMKQHVAIGCKILADTDEEPLRTARSVALTHHERWDGSGYLKGLRGEEIPLCGRICAVVDVFDALTSRRPYKEPWPMERALDQLRSDSGSHFDPAVVAAFLARLPEIEEIRAQFADVE